jgi:hypothetical protein
MRRVSAKYLCQLEMHLAKGDSIDSHCGELEEGGAC